MTLLNVNDACGQARHQKSVGQTLGGVMEDVLRPLLRVTGGESIARSPPWEALCIVYPRILMTYVPD